MKSIVLCLLLACLASSLTLSRGLTHELGAETPLHASLDVTTTADFNSKTSSLTTPYVVFFTASWCGPCKMQSSVLEKREKEAAGKWVVVKVDVDLEGLSEVVNKHGASGVPTLAFYKKGQKVLQRSGYVDDAAFRKLETQYLL